MHISLYASFFFFNHSCTFLLVSLYFFFFPLARGSHSHFVRRILLVPPPSLPSRDTVIVSSLPILCRFVFAIYRVMHAIDIYKALKDRVYIRSSVATCWTRTFDGKSFEKKIFPSVRASFALRSRFGRNRSMKRTRSNAGYLFLFFFLFSPHTKRHILRKNKLPELVHCAGGEGGREGPATQQTAEIRRSRNRRPVAADENCDTIFVNANWYVLKSILLTND